MEGLYKGRLDRIKYDIYLIQIKLRIKFSKKEVKQVFNVNHWFSLNSLGWFVWTILLVFANNFSIMFCLNDLYPKACVYSIFINLLIS